MRALAIINPIAGGGRARRVWPEVRAHLTAGGWAITDVTAEHRGHEADLAAGAAREGYDIVLAVGGDGTVHWTANGLLQAGSRSPALAIVPAGRGSDFAAAAGLPYDPLVAAELLLRSTRRRVDVGHIRCAADGGGEATRHYLTIGTVGFGGEVARQADEWRGASLPGTLMYVLAILKMLATYSPVDMEIALNGTTRRERLFMVCVGNTLRAAGGMRLCPGARADDGRFELVVIGNVTKFEVLRLLPKTFSGTHVLHPKVEVAEATTVTVSSDTALTVQADGEPIGRVPATFTVVPQALEVLAPWPEGG